MIRNFLESCDYENGYIKALLDAKNWFEQHSDSLRFARMYNAKGIPQILDCMMKNHTKMMDLGEDFEIFIKREDKKITLTGGKNE